MKYLEAVASDRLCSGANPTSSNLTTDHPSFMAKARALDRRRKSIRSIRKITRTMELISTAQFKRAMDRATAATAYTRRITALVGHLAHSGLEVTHPLLQPRPEPKRAILLVLAANRGLCGGYNAQRGAAGRRPLPRTAEDRARGSLEMAGKRGISAFRFRKIPLDETFTHFNDKPSFAEVDVLASRYLARFHRRRDRPARRGLHEVRERQPSAGGGRNAAAAGRAGRAPTRNCRPPSRSTSSCRRPRAFWTRWCRPVSR